MYPPGNTILMRRLKARKDAKQLRIFGHRMHRPHLPGHRNRHRRQLAKGAGPGADASTHSHRKRRRARMEEADGHSGGRRERRLRQNGRQVGGAGGEKKKKHGRAQQLQRQPSEVAQRASLEGLEYRHDKQPRLPIAGLRDASGEVPIAVPLAHMVRGGAPGRADGRLQGKGSSALQRQPSEAAQRVSLSGIDRTVAPRPRQPRAAVPGLLIAASSQPSLPLPPPQAATEPKATRLAQGAHAQRASLGAADGQADEAEITDQLADEILEEVKEEREIEMQQQQQPGSPPAQKQMESPFSNVQFQAASGSLHGGSPCSSSTAGEGQAAFGGDPAHSQPADGAPRNAESLYFPSASTGDPEALRNLPTTPSGHVLWEVQQAWQEQRQQQEEKQKHAMLRVGTMVKRKKKPGSNYRTYWDAVWIEPREIIDEGILISKQMASDHYTTTLLQSMQVGIHLVHTCVPVHL